MLTINATHKNNAQGISQIDFCLKRKITMMELMSDEKK